MRRGSLVESLPVSELPVFTPLPVARLHPHLHIHMFSISLSLDDETMKHEKKTFGVCLLLGYPLTIEKTLIKNQRVHNHYFSI